MSAARKNAIVVTVSFDKGYAEQATVMLYSLLMHNSDNRIVVVVFYDDLDEAAKKRVQSNLSRFSNFEIEWIKIDGALIRNFNIRKGHVNEYSYSRIFMAQMLQDVDRILYLDCDMLILGNLSELWQTDLQGCVLAAVQDPSPFVRHEDLGMPEGKKYFNAGVLLLDVNKWKKGSYTEAVVNKLTQLGGKAAWWDQDGLNAVLYNDWLALNRKWNIQSHDIAVAQEENIKKIKPYLSPSIVHFTGVLKPWNFKSSNPYKKEYYQLLRQTDFIKTHRPQNKTVVNVVRRVIRNTFVFAGLLKN
ncbi:glycosyltransferase family 8 protein [Flavisolibacter ginsenosidimutans]|uniref:Glycosyltransferase family 8 protein n=1 Tax=Flavisolibacter ginsenosidimutans TaxID=661481 RepID=A0A5B8UE86_9BACT|nr:glycosyltransferase family 8 protein [Flavisolibacter ginsenosidimutans]QEC54884.1 glycosyltransferase family 8 protein [Flavisolibacter ginsenosidimutans]